MDNFFLKRLWILLWNMALLNLFAAAQAPTIQSVTPQNISVGLYEKFEATIQLTAGYTNPYDYDDILVKAEFTAPSGKKNVIEGFFMQDYTLNTVTGNITAIGTPGFRIRFSPVETGIYTYTVTCMNTQGNTTTLEYNFTSGVSVAKGFVRKNATNYLNFDNGQQYIMIGQNMGWQQTNKYLDFKNWTDKMAANNANFIRLWQCAWGLGIEWTGTPYEGLKKYSQVNSFYTDKLLEECRVKDIYMMLTINHHGMVSSTVNPNWNENPYKSTNGGPCINTWDYFTNATAKALHKNRLRYIVARWGYSRNIMSWELFNEVEWTDQFETYKTQIKNWSQEMAQYLNAKDPFKHLVTTSYAHDNNDPNTWNLPEIDFTQTHYYNNAPNVETVLVGGIRNYLASFGKPTYTGEFGINPASSDLSTIDPNGTHIHNSVWATLFGGGMGSGASWWWDTYINPRNLYTHYKAPAAIAAQIPFYAENYKPASGTISGGGVSNLVISPAAGWGKPPAADFSIDASGNMTPSASSLSTYMYGLQCKAAEKNAPTFTVTFSTPSQFRVRTGNDISAFCNAQRVQIILNGTEVLNAPAVANTNYSIEVAAGTHTIKVDNAGGDWYTVAGYTFTNMGSPLNTYLLKSADNRRVAGWVHNKKYNWVDAAPGIAPPAPISGATLSVPALANGIYEVKWFECTNGTVQSTMSAVAAGGILNMNVPDVAWDLAFVANEVTTLPLTLTSFTGNATSSRNLLFIEILRDENVKQVAIERSPNGKDFVEIGKLKSYNSSFKGKHDFIDNAPLRGENYYRLKVLDKDGTFDYSQVILLEQHQVAAIQISPNPVANELMIKLPGGKFYFEVISLDGRKISNRLVQQQNSGQILLNVAQLPKGMYYLVIQSDQKEAAGQHLFMKN
jgi:hypothetical protein